MQTKAGIEITRRATFKITRTIDTCSNMEQLEQCLTWVRKIIDTESEYYQWMYSLYLQKKSVFVAIENKTFKKPIEPIAVWQNGGRYI